MSIVLAKKPSLEELKALLGAHRAAQSAVPAESRELRLVGPYSEVTESIPRGALTEISGRQGSGKSELVLSLLAQNPKVRAAWIEDRLTVYPAAFPQRGVDLERVLFVEAGAQTLWAALQTLRSGLFEVVVISESVLRGDVELRRLQLAAEKSLASVILLTERKRERRAWPIALSLQVVRKGNCFLTKGAGK